MIPGNAGLELSPDPHENLRRNHWSCLCRITSCSDIGKEVNVQLQANKTQSSCLPNPASLAPANCTENMALFFWTGMSINSLTTCGSTKMHVDHIADGCVLSGN